jgi:hypothetical protein
MPNAIHLKLDGLCDVVADQLKAWVTNPAIDIAFTTSEVIVEANHLFTGVHQPINQVRAKKTSSSSD